MESRVLLEYIQRKVTDHYKVESRLDFTDGEFSLFFGENNGNGIGMVYTDNDTTFLAVSIDSQLVDHIQISGAKSDFQVISTLVLHGLESESVFQNA